MDFYNFNCLITKRLDEMSARGTLFVTDVDTEVLWNKYLDSFPAGTNNIYKVRRGFDCSCCHNFVRRYGNVVAIDSDCNLMTMWDILPEYPYNAVVPILAEYVKTAPIKSLFLSEEEKMGVEKSSQLTDNGILTWNHFYYKPDKKFVNTRTSASVIGEYTNNKNVFERALKEITDDAIDTVLDLINQGSLYKGNEYKTMVIALKDYKTAYKTAQSENWIWAIVDQTAPSILKIRNTSIGALLVNLSENMDLDVAVSKYESIVAPTNYKRPKAIVSSKMIEEAQKKCVELNIDLNRRYAVKDDITVNNVLFVDRSSTILSGNDPFASLQQDVIPKNLSKIEEIDIEDFIKNVVPTASKIEALVDNKHRNNFMSLVAPLRLDATKMLKWDNNFSWSYKGSVTDSIKERVKEAGGKIDGYLRVSLSWSNVDDLDLYVITPSGQKIFFSNKNDYYTKGTLDVDMNAGGPKSTNPVENITFPAAKYLIDGEYKVGVNNYNQRTSQSQGFEVEIEVGDQLYNLTSDKNDVHFKTVATIVSKNGELTIKPQIESSSTSKNVNNIDTNKFKTVSMLLNSPNYWDNQTIGNKHYFFILEDCVLEETPRGFFNEYLRDDLITHKRVFEALGSKMIVPALENPKDQLSGVGFSSTVRNDLIVKVSGTFTRLLKIKF